MRRLFLAIAVVSALGRSPESAAQVQPPSSPVDSNQVISFEAASIKQNKSAGSGSFVGRQPGGRLNAQNAALRELIEFAYQIQPFQLLGGPSWIDVGRWDIVAKLAGVPVPTPQGIPDDALLALRTLMADRFKLVVRRETRQLPIYALVLARPDGKLGSQINESTIDCAALMAARNRSGGPPPAPAPPPDGRPQCGLRGRVGSVQSGGSRLPELANALSGRVQRIVVDRTGLTGAWDFTLTYTPEPSQIPQAVLTPGSPTPPFDPNGPSLFTALQEQLGLKLESTRGPVEVLVIERVERPAEN